MVQKLIDQGHGIMSSDVVHSEFEMRWPVVGRVEAPLSRSSPTPTYQVGDEAGQSSEALPWQDAQAKASARMAEVLACTLLSSS